MFTGVSVKGPEGKKLLRDPVVDGRIILRKGYLRTGMRDMYRIENAKDRYRVLLIR